MDSASHVDMVADDSSTPAEATAPPTNLEVIIEPSMDIDLPQSLSPAPSSADVIGDQSAVEITRELPDVEAAPVPMEVVEPSTVDTTTHPPLESHPVLAKV